MEYVSTVLIMSVLLGVLSLCAGGFKLTGAVRQVISLVMLVSVLLPLRELVNGAMPQYDIESHTSASVAETGEQLFLEECREAIESGVSRALTARFGEHGFGTEIYFDIADKTAVSITEADIRANNSAQGFINEIKGFVSMQLGCENVDITLEGEPFE